MGSSGTKGWPSTSGLIDWLAREIFLESKSPRRKIEVEKKKKEEKEGGKG